VAGSWFEVCGKPGSRLAGRFGPEPPALSIIDTEDRHLYRGVSALGLLRLGLREAGDLDLLYGKTDLTLRGISWRGTEALRRLYPD